MAPSHTASSNEAIIGRKLTHTSWQHLMTIPQNVGPNENYYILFESQ
jgi:hypothetical protein